jgi:hypothetical protein
VHGPRRARAEAGVCQRGEADTRGESKATRVEVDAHGGRAGRVRDEHGAVVSRLNEVWLYYDICSLIFFSFYSLCFLID